MGQKVHPIGIRLGYTKDWSSRWYANTQKYPEFLHQDIKVRELLKNKLAHASVSRIQINRAASNAHITIHTARPGIVIGKKGQDIEKLRAQLNARVKGVVSVSVEEMRKPELDAQLVADSIAQQLVGRVAYRRATKRSLQNAMRLGAEGIKIMVSGRLNGAEIARKEWYREGRVPLHTLRADVDYATAEALTTYGILGIKVWIYKGEVFANDSTTESTEKKKTASAK